ncbi:hypothetical protein C0J52_15295 [Blattella germanica]|nr:hypothetical protein C0J52_15295 [Blattella germanica]
MSDDSNGSTGICKRCKNKPVNGLRCQICSTVYHPSCAKFYSNIKYIDGDLVICCENVNPESESEKETTTDGLDYDVDGQVKISMFNTLLQQKEIIIEQKDIIISELRSKIELLNDKVKLLEEINILKSCISTSDGGTDEIVSRNSTNILNSEIKLCDANATNLPYENIVQGVSSNTQSKRTYKQQEIIRTVAERDSSHSSDKTNSSRLPTKQPVKFSDVQFKKS